MFVTTAVFHLNGPLQNTPRCFHNDWNSARIGSIRNQQQQQQQMDINYSLLKTGNKTAHINVKNCSLNIVLTATDQKPQKS